VPALDPAALRKHLAAGTLERLYVFLGEDVKLIDRMVDAVEATIDPADRPFAVDRVYATEAGGTPVEIAAACRSLPMLGDRRIVIVMRAERLLKPKRAGKAAEEDADDDAGDESESASTDFTPLEDYVGTPSTFATLVFVATEIDRTRRFTKKLVEKAQVVAFDGIRADPKSGYNSASDAQALAKKFVQDEMMREGRTIDASALKVLVDRSGGDISKLRGDLERLLLFVGARTAITGADADEVATDAQTVQDDWAVTNAIGDGDAARALREVALRFERGDSPHGIVGQLRWWVSNRLAESAGDRVKPALDALLRTDLALKSSGGEDHVLVERLVVELTGKPVARGGFGGGFGGGYGGKRPTPAAGARRR
jgi:DNA polymerase III delta subunit